LRADELRLIGGTKDAFRDNPPCIFLDGISTHEQWSSPEPHRAEWEDPLWTALGTFVLRPEAAAAEIADGCALIAIGTDTTLLASAAATAIQAARNG
jgi:hypothetical protein